MTPIWSGALAWRMRQQLLDPVGSESAVYVVRPLGLSRLGRILDRPLVPAVQSA